MGLKLEFTLDLPGASKVALKVDHDKDGLIDEEKYVDLEHHGSKWVGTVELTDTDPEGVLYLYTVTTRQDASTYEVTVVRADTRAQVGKVYAGPIAKGRFYLGHWVGDA